MTPIRARCTRVVMFTVTVEVQTITGGVDIDMLASILRAGGKVYLVISLLSVA